MAMAAMTTACLPVAVPAMQPWGPPARDVGGPWWKAGGGGTQRRLLIGPPGVALSSGYRVLLYTA